jgi:hypothetical protein
MITFLISLFCSIYLIFFGRDKDDLFAGIITLLIGLMQGIEYILWKYPHGIINHRASLGILFLLYLQPVVSSIAYYFIYGSDNLWLITGLCILFTGITGYILFWLNKRKLNSRPGRGSCRLVWAPFSVLYHTSWKTFFIFWAFLFFYFAIIGIMYFSLEWMNKYPVRNLILPVSFIIASIYSLYMNGVVHSADIFGSVWCFMAVGFGIVSILHV